jgi:hypothetical protein
MRQGGDRGKSPNATGTRPKKRRVDAPGPKPGRRAVKGGAGRGGGHPKHAAQRASGQRTTATRKAGPKKTQPKTTRRSAEK